MKKYQIQAHYWILNAIEGKMTFFSSLKLSHFKTIILSLFLFDIFVIWIFLTPLGSKTLQFSSFSFLNMAKKLLFINKHFQGLFISILGPNMKIGQTDFVDKHAVRVDFIGFVCFLVVKRVIKEHVLEKVRNKVSNPLQRSMSTWGKKYSVLSGPVKDPFL